MASRPTDNKPTANEEQVLAFSRLLKVMLSNVNASQRTAVIDDYYIQLSDTKQLNWQFSNALGRWLRGKPWSIEKAEIRDMRSAFSQLYGVIAAQIGATDADTILNKSIATAMEKDNKRVDYYRKLL